MTSFKTQPTIPKRSNGPIFVVAGIATAALIFGAFVAYFIGDALAVGVLLEGGSGASIMTMLRGVAVMAIVVLAARFTIPKLRARSAPSWTFLAVSAAAFLACAAIIAQSFVLGEVFASSTPLALLLDAVLWSVATSIGDWWGRSTRP